MEITPDSLREIILDDLYIDKLYHHFPRFVGKIKDVRKKPKCSGCLDKVSASLLNHESSQWKFSQILDVNKDEISIPEYIPKKQITWKQKTEVHKVERKNYENFVSDLYADKPHPAPQIKMFNTFYEPVEDRVVVTLVLLAPVEE